MRPFLLPTVLSFLLFNPSVTWVEATTSKYVQAPAADGTTRFLIQQARGIGNGNGDRGGQDNDVLENNDVANNGDDEEEDNVKSDGEDGKSPITSPLSDNDDEDTTTAKPGIGAGDDIDRGTGNNDDADYGNTTVIFVDDTDDDNSDGDNDATEDKKGGLSVPEFFQPVPPPLLTSAPMKTFSPTQNTSNVSSLTPSTPTSTYTASPVDVSSDAPGLTPPPMLATGAEPSPSIAPTAFSTVPVPAPTTTISTPTKTSTIAQPFATARFLQPFSVQVAVMSNETMATEQIQGALKLSLEQLLESKLILVFGGLTGIVLDYVAPQARSNGSELYSYTGKGFFDSSSETAPSHAAFQATQMKVLSQFLIELKELLKAKGVDINAFVVYFGDEGKQDEGTNDKSGDSLGKQIIVGDNDDYFKDDDDENREMAFLRAQNSRSEFSSVYIVVASTMTVALTFIGLGIKQIIGRKEPEASTNAARKARKNVMLVGSDNLPV